uniref:Uncharacterized protein n=1 Tax=Chrysodeixis includens nucleopolyhedrovirus TaxID=1207438 RepID=A0A1C8ZYK3_9ABAC|nr:hypothetical protein [Chrysodeixis includens nucleopolyhedrovirus]
MSSRTKSSNSNISLLPKIRYLALEKLFGFKPTRIPPPPGSSRRDHLEFRPDPLQYTYIPYVMHENNKTMIIQDGDLFKHLKNHMCKYIALYSGIQVVFNTKKHAAGIKLTAKRTLSDMCILVIWQALSRNQCVKFDSLHSAQKIRDKIFSLNLPNSLRMQIFFSVLPNHSVILEETRQVTRLQTCRNNHTRASVVGNLYEDFFCWTCGVDLFENYVPFVLDVESIVEKEINKIKCKKFLFNHLHWVEC